MRVYRNSDGYIVTFTPDDVSLFKYGHDSPMTCDLINLVGFFEFFRGGDLRGMDNQQPKGRALAEFAVHCRDFAKEDLLASTKNVYGEYESQLTVGETDCESCGQRVSESITRCPMCQSNLLGVEHDIGGEG